MRRLKLRGDVFVLTAREQDWLDCKVESRLALLDSLFDLSEEEWVACERRLYRRGLALLRKRRSRDGKADGFFCGRRELSSELDEVESESWDGSFCFFCGSPGG